MVKQRDITTEIYRKTGNRTGTVTNDLCVDDLSDPFDIEVVGPEERAETFAFRGKGSIAYHLRIKAWLRGRGLPV